MTDKVKLFLDPNYKGNNVQQFKIDKVIKRDGTIEDFDYSKIEGWAKWAGKLSSASWSSVIMAAIKKLPAGSVDSEQLMEVLIKSAEEMIDQDVGYDKFAAALMLAQLRKRLFDSFYPPSLKFFHDCMVAVNAWSDKSEWLSEDDFAVLDAHIVHDRDGLFTSAGLKQFMDKYSRRNIKTDEIYETPQFMYMGMAMELMAPTVNKQTGEVTPGYTLEDAIDLYDALSLQKINVPTPPLVGLRSGDRGFASCCLVDATDTLDSIDAAQHIVFKMVAARAGIGYHLESRSVSDPVRHGAFPHSGKLPYYRHIDRSVKANTQQSRGGSATVSYPFFDPELYSIFKAKSNRSPEDAKIDKMDYSMSFNALLMKRYVQKGNITLMSYLHAPEVHEAFYSADEAKFEEIYIAAEKRLAGITQMGIDGKSAPVAPVTTAAEILGGWVTVRMETGRMYAHNIAESNRHGAYLDPIRMTNLCVEITQPTVPAEHVLDWYMTPDQLDRMEPGKIPEVSLCNLAGLVLGRIHTHEEWEKYCYIALKFVDTIIEIQDYDFPTLEYTAKARRNVGIGLMNAAGAMAAEGLAYEGVEARNWIHRETEKMSFFLHKASVRLAQERGEAKWFHRTKAAKGILVIDNYKKTVDELVSVGLELDWEGLRADIHKYGMRNSVLTAQMPGESSSVLLGVTNSLEPPRQLVTVKTSAVNKVVSIVPGLDDWDTRISYKLAFDIDREEWIKWVGVAQKFFSQSISTNMYYDYNKFPEGKIPQAAVIRDFMLAWKYGFKTWYYANFEVSNGGSAHEQAEACSGGGCTL
ncbi:ribonucleoside-diphosphate reductase I subunit alpha [Serratia phage vB_SmaM-Kamaji]|nr:ribonucleoside-diphosphate reductase I subunit alpha [Serratia phage vB_SmaM-Kamaji]